MPDESHHARLSPKQEMRLVLSSATGYTSSQKDELNPLAQVFVPFP